MESRTVEAERRRRQIASPAGVGVVVVVAAAAAAVVVVVVHGKHQLMFQLDSLHPLMTMETTNRIFNSSRDEFMKLKKYSE